MIGPTAPSAAGFASPMTHGSNPNTVPVDQAPPDAIALCGQASYRSMDINARGYEGRSQLHEAAEAGDITRVMALLQGGADVFMRDENGATPRWLADQNQRSDVVAAIDAWKGRLLDRFVEVAGRGDAVAVQHFCDNTSIPYSERVQVLNAAAQGKCAPAVECLLETYGYAERDIDSLVQAGVSDNGVEQLLLSKMLFARVNHWEPREIHAFLERHPSLDVNHTWNGSSALHQVVQYGQFPQDLGKIRALLDAGAMPNVVNDAGYTVGALANFKGLNKGLINVAALFKQ
ncbi:hypothetical protein [Stenotrophomonas sp. AB1(2024)]|uniref:hypothetical protein n=1 Tax=Stenotrophomonas sp. AB1(2024) TaxID=3132215 RepID=UPI0030A5D6E3